MDRSRIRRLASWSKRHSGPRDYLPALCPLETRCVPTVSANLVGHNLMIQATGADLVYIQESAAGTFRVGDGAADAAASPQSYTGLKDIRVKLLGSGALVYVAGVMNPPDAPDAAGIAGNLNVTARPGSTLAIEVHDGFTAKGIQVMASGATFQSHWTIELPGNSSPSDQYVDGLFIDPNRRGTFGSIQVVGAGTVGLDGVKVLGDVNVNLGSGPNNSFDVDREWVNSEDPDSPPWTKFQQDPTTIGGNLTVNGGHDAQLYNMNVAGNVKVTQETKDPGGYNVAIGAASIGGNLTVNSPGGAVGGTFIDFSTVGGDATISQGGGQAVLGLQASYFGRKTTITQAAATNRLFIDSGSALAAAASATPGLPTDSGYLGRLSAAGVRPADTGSRFLRAVTAKQSGGTNALVIGQDKLALSGFTAPSTFVAAPGSSSTAQVKTTSVPPTVVGYRSQA